MSARVGIIVADPAGHLVASDDTTAGRSGGLDPDLPPHERAPGYGLRAADGTPLPPEELPLQQVLRGGRVDRTELVVVTAGHAARAQLAERASSWPGTCAQVPALARTSRTVTTADDPHVAICEAVRELTGAEAGHLLQPDGRGHLVSTAAVGFAEDFEVRLDLAADIGLPTHAHHGCRQLLVADVASHPDAHPVVVTPSSSPGRGRPPGLAAGAAPGGGPAGRPRRPLAPPRAGAARGGGVDAADAGRRGRPHDRTRRPAHPTRSPGPRTPPSTTRRRV